MSSLHLRWFSCIAIIFFQLAAHVRAADVVSTWDNSTGNWSDATKWSTDNFPNDGNDMLTYDAVIGGGAVTLDQDITVQSVSVSNAVLEGASDLDVLVDLTWQSGTIRGRVS